MWHEFMVQRGRAQAQAWEIRHADDDVVQQLAGRFALFGEPMCSASWRHQRGEWRSSSVRQARISSSTNSSFWRKAPPICPVDHTYSFFHGVVKDQSCEQI